jgi:hypothetical protein
MTVSMMQAALNYVAEGFRVFPVNIDKKPLNEHGLKDATQIQLGVKDYWTKWSDAGIGIVTDGLIVVDFDVKSGGLESKAKLEAEHGPFPQTRTHRTGGGGLHLIYRNPDGTDIRNKVTFAGYAGVDIRANGGYIVAPPSLHYSGRRYEVLDNFPISPAPSWLLVLAGKKQIPQQESPLGGQPIPAGQRNQTLASLAGTMRRRGMAEEAIGAALLETNKLQCQPPLPEGEVKTIARSVSRYSPDDSIIKHVCINTNGTEKATLERDKIGTKSGTSEAKVEAKTGQDKNISMADRVLDWVKGTTGWFATEELDRDLGVTAQEKENRRKIMLRLKDQSIIESHPKINKQFRYVNTRITTLNFKNANTAGVLPIKWPLGMEKYVNLFPGNIAVIAGSPNAGKTAMMLNFIYLNQNQFPIYYFCSEMGEVELRDRLDKFPGMDINDWKFEAIERASDFADVIRPDCVNVIDYLEMTTELYQVNEHLTNISHKLGSGLVVLALQKKVGATYGRGQEFGLEKPKLYISLDKNIVRIVKGKSWAQKTIDPNGLQVPFNIVGGCQFQATGKWDYKI